MSTSSDLRIIEEELQGSDWLNAREAAQYLRILSKNGEPCVERVRNLVSQRKIPFYKPFGRLLFKRSELQKIIETSRKGSMNGYK